MIEATIIGYELLSDAELKRLTLIALRNTTEKGGDTRFTVIEFNELAKAVPCRNAAIVGPGIHTLPCSASGHGLSVELLARLASQAVLIIEDVAPAPKIKASIPLRPVIKL